MARPHVMKDLMKDLADHSADYLNKPFADPLAGGGPAKFVGVCAGALMRQP